jgi:hypothetical protein
MTPPAPLHTRASPRARPRAAERPPSNYCISPESGMAPSNLLDLQDDEQRAELVKNWKFEEGLKFQTKVCLATGRAVHHASSSRNGSFSLLSVFRRFTFRFTEKSVSLALVACLGGTPAGFHVSFVKDRHFRFEVSCKTVGFMVCEHKRVISEQFDIYFHLWRDGGANWIREEKHWSQEEEQSWKKISHQKRFIIRFGSFECNLKILAKPILQDFSPESNSNNIHGVLHNRQGKELEVEEDVQIQITCDKVFGNIKRALNINDKTHSEAFQYKAQLRAVNDVLGNRARILRWGVCFKCLGQGHHVRDCRGNFRCLHCFNFGHRAKIVWGKKSSLKWAPKRPGTKTHTSAASLNCNASPEDHSSPPPASQPLANNHHSSPSTEASPSHPSQLPLNSSTPNSQPPPQQNFCQSEEEEDMAAFDIEHERFIPTGMDLEDGGPNRRERVTFCFSGAPIRRHEGYAIAVTDEQLTPAQRLAFMHVVREYIRVVARRHGVSYSPHPHGIGIYCFQSSCDRVYNSAHWIGNRQFSLVNHDEAMNCRRSVFVRVGWVMLVGYPLDYKESQFIHQAYSPVGKVIQWHSNDNSKARILAKVLIENVATVPRVIILKSGRALDGEGRAWLVRVFILNSQFADQIIDDDEDDFPNNGNNNNGGNGNNDEAAFVANLADLHQ